MTEEDIKAAIRAGVVEALDGERLAPLIAEAVEAQEKKKEDPYRTTIHFLAGLIAFCLAVIVGVFAEFPEPADKLRYPMLGGVLAWMTITVILAATSLLLTQRLKGRYRETWSAATQPPKQKWHYLLMGLPAAFGLGAVYYCLRGGAAMLSGQETLLPLGEALRALF